jgi:hypothetical protein
MWRTEWRGEAAHRPGGTLAVSSGLSPDERGISRTGASPWREVGYEERTGVKRRGVSRRRIGGTRPERAAGSGCLYGAGASTRRGCASFWRRTLLAVR